MLHSIEAWSCRYEQDIEGFLRHFSAVKNANGVRNYQDLLTEIAAQEGQKRGHKKTQVFEDILLMQASWLRLEGQVAESNLILDRLADQVRLRGATANHQFWMQRGLNALTSGDHTSALDAFLSAESSATNSIEKLRALVNVLFSFENLGLAADDTWKRIQSELKGPSRQNELPKSISSQLRAYEMRRCFREGRIQEGLSPGASARNIAPDQAHYYRIWLRSLPYTRFDSTQADEVSAFASFPSSFHQKNYRLRTLQGLLHPDDLSSPKASEFADRFYLWTWRWLTAPETCSLQKVMSILKGVSWSEISARFTSEDYQLVRNSFLWLSLFDPKSERFALKMDVLLKPHHFQSFPLLEFERQLAGLFLARREGDGSQEEDLRIQLKLNPLWKSEDLRFRGLLESTVMGGPMGGLQKRLQDVLKGSQSINDFAQVKVDLTIHQLMDCKTGRTVISIPLTEAVDILYRRRSISCSDLALFCFGITRYDSETHSTKIFNLISRMRQCLPKEFSIKVKAGVVFASGPWDSVEFTRKPEEAGNLHDQPEWRELMHRAVRPYTPEKAIDRRHQTSLMLEKLSGKAEIHRRDIEKIIGKSRSTANRIISRWIHRGIIQKSGSARKTRYKIMR